jgi:hypothetical protein
MPGKLTPEPHSAARKSLLVITAQQSALADDGISAQFDAR